MLNGDRFRADCELAAQQIHAGRIGTGAPAAARRASKWADFGAEAIDDGDANKATRYLLALIGNLSDQHSINTQAIIRSSTRWILVPLWIAALALMGIAFR